MIINNIHLGKSQTPILKTSSSEINIKISNGKRLINLKQANKDSELMTRRLNKSNTKGFQLSSKTPGIKLQQLDGDCK